MKIVLCTSNMPRHVNLAEELSTVCDLTVIVETTTPAATGYSAMYTSETQAAYFNRVNEAERLIFGEHRPFQQPCFPIPMGHLTKFKVPEADRYIVFGSSYIRKGDTLDRLMKGRAMNLHAGVSPDYRGSACNAWAALDGGPVGTTFHAISPGLDSGAIAWTTQAISQKNVFGYTMNAVYQGQKKVVQWVRNGAAFPNMTQQNPELTVRYTTAADWTDEVAQKLMDR